MRNDYVRWSVTSIRPMIDYYDTVLVLIPLTFAGVGGVLVAGGVARLAAVAIGAAAAALLVTHALFVNGPVAAADVSPSVRSAHDTAPPGAD
jgi:hypothetical protein